MNADHDSQTNGAFHHFHLREKKDVPELPEGIRGKDFADMTLVEKRALGAFIEALVVFVDDEDLDYQVADHYLSQLAACRFSGPPREGFDFWHGHFLSLPSATDAGALREKAAVLLGTSPFHTSSREVVVIGMRAFCNCLRQRHYELTRWRELSKGNPVVRPPSRLSSPRERQRRGEGLNGLINDILREQGTTLDRLEAQTRANAGHRT